MERLRRSLGTARLADGAAFFTQGLVFISLTTRLPDVRDRWDFSEVTLSLILLMMVVLAGVGSVLAERAARSTDSALVLRAGLLLMAVAVPVLVLAPAFPVFVAGMAAYGVALGVVDASTNMQAVAIEHRYGRPILPSFHGMWTLGGIVGSVITLSTSSVSFRWAAVVALLPLAIAFAPYLRRDHGVIDADAQAVAEAVPWRPLLLVGAALVLFYMVDTAASTWGPTYLDDAFDTPSGPRRPRDAALPRRQRRDAARRRHPGRATRAGGGASVRRPGRLRRARRHRARADLADRGAGLHGARTRRRRDRAAGLLGGRGARRRRPR